MPRSVLRGLMVYLFALLLAYAQECEDASSTAVTAQGFAAIISDEISAKKEAVKDALRQAVEQVGGVVVEASAVVTNFQLVNEEIQTRTAAYVTSSEILEAGPDAQGRLYTVSLQACVSPDIPPKILEDIKAELESFGYILKEQLGNPRIVIQTQGVEEVNLATATQNILMDYFRELGFSIRSQAATDCPTLAAQVNTLVADILICAQVGASVQESNVSKGMYTAKADIRLEASLISNQQILASTSSESKQKPSSVQDRAAQEAIKEALALPILESFTTELVKNLNASTETTTSIQIIIQGLPDIQSSNKVRAFIDSIQGVERVQDRGMSEGAAILEVEGSITAESIVNRLEAIEGVPLRITGYSAFSITAELRE